MGIKRLHILITGQVQGVGFRPHVYRIAQHLQLSGWVQNTAKGVVVEIQGPNVGMFIEKLSASPPPLANIDTIQTQEIAFIHDDVNFKIITSEPGIIHTMITADTCICTACLNELFDPQSHYYHYPFLNCTHCGPRLTITEKLPYDRQYTSMSEFPLCEDCTQNYSDPSNRRYHAQPIACRHCGPELSHSLDAIAQALMAGQIIALKGLGGYQLFCDARNKTTIVNLRQRKNRSAKPFALMVLNPQSAESIVELDSNAKQLLMSPARPIVLLKQHDATLPQSIAPGLSHLGIMLPSTPLHYLLFHALLHDPQGNGWLEQAQHICLIATSANLAGEPLMIDDKAAQQQLSSIADVVVSYNRRIVTRIDDSVARLIHNAPVLIRRARGFAPECIKLPYSIPSTLALGAHLKNTFCITRDDKAFVSQHIGNLTNRATIEFFHESLTHWLRFLNVNIERIACDLHPDFYTSRYAHEYGLNIVPVQHHHAHLAAVAAEHHILKPTLGLILDGYGYGTNGEAWGGELLYLDTMTIKRLGSFLPIPQPSGEIAVREPWRMAASVLHQLGRNQDIVQRFPTMPQAASLAYLLKTEPNIPLTSSCGRLFDAASALLGVTAISHYEGQAAQCLESLVTHIEVLSHGWHIHQDHFSVLPLFNHLSNLTPIQGANLFHGTLAEGLAEWILITAKRMATDIILLSGGCFLNKILSEALTKRLIQHGLEVYLPQRVPPNDAGLSLGQAWVAGASLNCHRTTRIKQCV